MPIPTYQHTPLPTERRGREAGLRDAPTPADASAGRAGASFRPAGACFSPPAPPKGREQDAQNMKQDTETIHTASRTG